MKANWPWQNSSLLSQTSIEEQSTIIDKQNSRLLSSQTVIEELSCSKAVEEQSCSDSEYEERESESESGDESGSDPLRPTVNKLITEFHKKQDRFKELCMMLGEPWRS